MIITQNGEAKAIIQDVTPYEETQETLALLKILALGAQQVERGEIIAPQTPLSPAAKNTARISSDRDRLSGDNGFLRITGFTTSQASFYDPRSK